MLLSLLSLILFSGNVDDALEPTGTIRGVVVNGTHGNEAIDDVVVVLRAGQDGFLEPVAETRTDLYGKFTFQGVPLDPAATYLPGADRDGVHYPGDRVRLDLANRYAHATIVSFDALQAPTPLVARRHEIDILIQQEVMEVSEALLIANRERATYVGEPAKESRPVTMRLSIPPSFDRVIFGSEFYGRRFWIVDRQPVTDIPWPPGERELKFKYRVPIANSGGIFRRVLDMPCADVRVRVRGKTAEQLSCNLPLAKDNDTGDTIFASGDEPLPAGQAIELEIGRESYPWMQYARWGSLATLAALSLATVIILRRTSYFWFIRLKRIVG